MELTEREISQNVVFDGRIIQVRDDDYLLPDGKKVKREIVAHNGGVCVGLLTKDDCILLVKQFRCPYSDVLIEVPAGKLEKGEDPYDAGIREAKEETGADVKQMISLGKFYPTPGYCGETIYLYYAKDFEISEQRLDEDELLTVERIPFSKAVEMVLSGEIRDGKTQTVILKLYALKKEGRI